MGGGRGGAGGQTLVLTGLLEGVVGRGIGGGAQAIFKIIVESFPAPMPMYFKAKLNCHVLFECVLKLLIFL